MEINTDSSSSSQQPQLPPGFRFHPTDEELVVHYLKKKASSSPLPVTIIAEIDLYKFDPWELPGKATFGDQEWYFFSPRDRKYPNGARPNRAATSGYWKATGTDKPILTSGGTQKVGVKKALVFYGGKPPKGIKTNWIMHEYRLTGNDTNMKPPYINPAAKNTSLRLDDWVLCRIYKKNNSQRSIDKDDSMEDMLGSLQPTSSKFYFQRDLEPKLTPKSINCDGVMLQNDENYFDGLFSTATNSINIANSTPQFASSSLPTSSSLKPLFSSMLPTSTTESTHTLKRILPSHYNWTETGIISPQSAKKFHANHDNNNNGVNGCSGNINDGSLSPMETLLTQLPPPPPPATLMHHHPLLGSLGSGDGFFRQPYQISGMNWNP